MYAVTYLLTYLEWEDQLKHVPPHTHSQTRFTQLNRTKVTMKDVNNGNCQRSRSAPVAVAERRRHRLSSVEPTGRRRQIRCQRAKQPRRVDQRRAGAIERPVRRKHEARQSVHRRQCGRRSKERRKRRSSAGKLVCRG